MAKARAKSKAIPDLPVDEAVQPASTEATTPAPPATPLSRPVVPDATNTSTDGTEKREEPSEYTVVARRYRPQQFSDLIGQEHVAEALSNAIRSGRIAHAYLFTGGRGVGKTSSARILAKALNCVNGPTPTPCDQCEI